MSSYGHLKFIIYYATLLQLNEFNLKTDYLLFIRLVFISICLFSLKNWGVYSCGFCLFQERDTWLHAGSSCFWFYTYISLKDQQYWYINYLRKRYQILIVVKCLKINVSIKIYIKAIYCIPMYNAHKGNPEIYK